MYIELNLHKFGNLGSAVRSTGKWNHKIYSGVMITALDLIPESAFQTFGFGSSKKWEHSTSNLILLQISTLTTLRTHDITQPHPLSSPSRMITSMEERLMTTSTNFPASSFLVAGSPETLSSLSATRAHHSKSLPKLPDGYPRPPHKEKKGSNFAA